MAYTNKDPQDVPSTGLLLAGVTFTAIPTGSGNGLTFKNTGLVYVRNTSAGSLNLTLKTNLAREGITLGDKSIAVAAAAAGRDGFVLLKDLPSDVYGFKSGDDYYIRVEASGSGLELALLS